MPAAPSAPAPAPVPLHRIFAPWTEAQVELLNRWQASDVLHPYTCGNCAHGTVLTATRFGWHCPNGCGWKQRWCHACMLSPGVLEAWAEMRDLIEGWGKWSEAGVAETPGGVA